MKTNNIKKKTKTNLISKKYKKTKKYRKKPKFGGSLYKKTRPEIVKLLYKLLFDTINIFEDNKLIYWADAGTQIGALRHNGIIPWDDDIDIGIYQEKEIDLLNLRSQFNRKGYEIIKKELFYKIFLKNRDKIQSGSKIYEWSFPFVDIFTYKKNNNKYEITNNNNNLWKDKFYYEDELFPLKKHIFGNYTINIPLKSEKYCKRNYGDNWFNVGEQIYNHEKEHYVKKIKFKLTPNDRLPAKPF